ncbi:MAG: putative integral rane protein [Frankiales bacterium]|nr:putative integral rane protein [Frankiales bacterium]
MSRAEWVAGTIALVLAVLHQLLLPDSGTDLAAQLARASFARDAPLTPVDLSWYGGVHPYGYSLLTPWLMAVTGVAVAGIVAAVLGAVLFARLLRGQQHPGVAGALGACFSVADVVSGRTTFALGAVALLAALLCRERRAWAILLAVLTALLSPVAAAFLGFCAAVLVLHRRSGGWTLGLATTVPVVLLGVLFPGGGVQPFSVGSAVPALLVTAGLALLTRHPLVRTGAVLYFVAILLFLGHGDPFGSNVLRLGMLVAAPLAVATAHRGALLSAALVAGSLYWQVDPLQGDLMASDGPGLRDLTSELVSLDARRVEVVAPREHRESWRVAEHVPLARGWGRQVDYRDNRLFYTGKLTAGEYVDWLHGHGVDHVALPRHATIDFGGTREAKLLRKPVPGLTQVWQDRDWTVWAVEAPTPLATAPATVLASTRTDLTVRAPEAARIQVLLRWSRWLSVSGPACLARSGDQVELRFSGPGTAVIGSGLRPRGHC